MVDHGINLTGALLTLAGAETGKGLGWTKLQQLLRNASTGVGPFQTGPQTCWYAQSLGLGVTLIWELQRILCWATAFTGKCESWDLEE